jgi:hypothetical protein
VLEPPLFGFLCFCGVPSSGNIRAGSARVKMPEINPEGINELGMGKV